MSIGRTNAVTIAFILLVGIALRIGANVAPGSLWFDELATALNVVDREWADLLEPLGYRQIAPVGFLAAGMAGMALLGSGEAGVRLFPLIASVASLVLFWRIASRFLAGVTLYGALALFSVSPAMVWYARKAKQYAGDVSVTLVLLLLAIRFQEGPRTARRGWIAGAVGCVAIQFSHPAVFVAMGLFVALLVQTWRSRSAMLPLVPIGSLWSLGCLIQWITTQRLVPPATENFMTAAWQFAFFPAPWKGLGEALWLPRTLFDFVGFMVGLMEPDSAWEVAFLGVYALFMMVGVVYLFRTRGTLALLLFTPLAVAILAAAVWIIPLNGRLMIYAGPSLLLACLAGVEGIRARLGRRSAVVVAAGLVAAPAAFLPFLLPTLNRHEDAGLVLRQVRERWHQGDVIYVYEWAEQAMRYYGEPLGLEPWIAGQAHGSDPRALLEDVDTLRGHPRAWFFYTHAAGCAPALVRSYLQTIGTEVDRIDDPHGVRGMHEAGAGLYDLSDPGRLRRSSAVSHPLLDRRDPRCRGEKSVGAKIRDQLRDLVAPLDRG